MHHGSGTTKLHDRHMKFEQLMNQPEPIARVRGWGQNRQNRQIGHHSFMATWLACVLFLGGCTSLPKLDPPPPTSQALPLSTQTPLGRLAVASMQELSVTPEPTRGSGTSADTTSAPKMPDGSTQKLSGFRLLPLGTHSLDARLQLVQRAQTSLDLQYYHFADDSTGRALLRALRDAAARGVRVRVLIDDLYTGGADAMWLGFAAHAGVEVRLFNPFTAARGSGATGRFVAAPWDWGRINHRMHNKLFIADGAWALFGGRNIADIYYLKLEADNFIDLDVLAAGALLPTMQADFDRYWNAPTAYPLAAIVKAATGPHSDASARRLAFDALTAPARAELAMPAELAPKDVLGQPPVGRQLDEPFIALVPGRAQVLSDHPEKPFQGAPGGELMNSSVTFGVYQAMMQAQSEVLASSPYFVPGREGLALIAGLRERGVAVRVLTNSLASTDEPLVHLAYARYRAALLGSGVQLFELSQQRVKDNMRMFLFGASLGRLHSKTVVVDERVTFLGSMNLDPRSATLNTEFGALIDSPALARQVKTLIDIDRLHSAYALRLAPDGGCCEWVIPDSDNRLVLNLEPDSSWWMRWLGSLLQPLAPENHL
jgi:cardiolipin synthase C